MKTVILSSEVAPFAKTGGLADVTGALPKFLSKLGLEIRVIMPLYQEVKKKGLNLKKVIDNHPMDWGGSLENFSVFEYQEGSFRAYFIEKDDYYHRDYLYGIPAGDYPDNGQRFAFFSKASFETLKQLNFSPDILHCHDWQTSVALAYLKFIYSDDFFFKGTRSLFTIHNLAYQGLFEKEVLSQIGLPDHLFNLEDMEFYGRVNFLKAGILYSTAVSTVSPRYSQEIQTPELGYGLDGLLRKRSKALFGILNGVDYSSWNPATDKLIFAPFAPEDLRGKRECKRDLLNLFQLPSQDMDVPIAGMVSRLASQKGLDILCESLEEMFKLGVYLVILGTGDEKIQNILKSTKGKYPTHLGLKIAFDDAVAHKIISGSDLLLIPSRYEPCGLTQMYSLKYGTIPVVRATGGLDDSIQEFDGNKLEGNGFKFEDYSAEALLAALKKAYSLYHQKEKWQNLIQNALSCDFSWDKAAGEYLSLYKKLFSI